MGQWVPRIVSHLGSIDPAIYSSCSSGSADKTNLAIGRPLRRRPPMHRASALRRNSHLSPSASRRCGQSCWQVPPPRALAACASAGRPAKVMDDRGHMWTAPVAQEVFEVRSDRLHPYVRPVGAIGLDRWPRWFPRREFQSITRPVLGQWVPRIVSHLGSIDPAIYSSCSSGSAEFLDRLISQAADADAPGIRVPS